MAKIEEIRKQFADLKKTVTAQTARLLDQARQDQREALSMAMTVIEQQAKIPASLYIPRERKCSDFTGSPAQGEPCIEEWIASMKSSFKVARVPEEDKIELIKQHLKGEAKLTARFLLREGNTDVTKVFRKNKMLKEQFVLGLRDDFLRRETKRQEKAQPALAFLDLMNAAITWSEEEETPEAAARGPVRGAVHATAAEEVSSPLTLTSLHEAIQSLAARQEELFKTVHGREQAAMPTRPARPPLRDDEGRLTCYSCNQPGHTSRMCRQGKPAEHRVKMAAVATTEGQAEGDTQGPSVLISGLASAGIRAVTQANERDSATSSGAFGECFTIDVLIDGVKTSCLLDTGSEVTTIPESYFREHFQGTECCLSPAKWVRLTAANGLEIPIVGCLEADIECMGKLLKGLCVFVLKDSCSGKEERGKAPGILGMNVIGELKGFLTGFKGIKKLDRGTPQPGHASLRRILATMEEEEWGVGPNGWMGFVKVAGKRAVTIPPFSEKVIEGRFRIPPRVTSKVLVEASAIASLACGLLVAGPGYEGEGPSAHTQLE